MIVQKLTCHVNSQTATAIALKVCAKNWSLSHDELLSHLQLPPLSERRSQAKLCHLFKIMHGSLGEI